MEYVRGFPKVTVRHSETGLVYKTSPRAAELNEALTVLDDDKAAEATARQDYESMTYPDLRAAVARREIQPASQKQADLIAALVADDTKE